MDSFSWTSYPLKDSSPAKKLIAVFGIILMLFVGWVWLSWVGLIASFIAVAITFIQFVLPTKYTLKENSVFVEFMFSKREYDFSRYKSMYVDNTGILLSPFANPNRLENFRGLYVRYGRENKEKIIEIVKTKIS